MREEPLEHVGDVARTAGRGVVARVADQVRAGARGETPRDAPIRVASWDAESEVASGIPVALREGSRLAHDRIRIDPGHEDRGAAAWLVGPGVADPHSGVDDPGELLDHWKTPVDAARRLVPRAGPLAREQDRDTYPRFQRAHAVP